MEKPGEAGGVGLETSGNLCRLKYTYTEHFSWGNGTRYTNWVAFDNDLFTGGNTLTASYTYSEEMIVKELRTKIGLVGNSKAMDILSFDANNWTSTTYTIKVNFSNGNFTITGGTANNSAVVGYLRAVGPGSGGMSREFDRFRIEAFNGLIRIVNCYYWSNTNAYDPSMDYYGQLIGLA